MQLLHALGLQMIRLRAEADQRHVGVMGQHLEPERQADASQKCAADGGGRPVEHCRARLPRHAANGPRDLIAGTVRTCALVERI